MAFFNIYLIVYAETEKCKKVCGECWTHFKLPVSQEPTTVKWAGQVFLELLHVSIPRTNRTFIYIEPTPQYCRDKQKKKTDKQVGNFTYNTAYPLIFIRVFCTHLWNGEIFGQHWQQPKRDKSIEKHQTINYQLQHLDLQPTKGFILLKGMLKTLVKVLMFKIQHEQDHREDIQNI